MEQDPMEDKKELFSQIQAIVDNSNDAIIGATIDGIITSWNGGATKMLGYSAPEAIGKSISFLFPPEMQGEIPALITRVKAGEVIADCDSARLRKDGVRIEVSFSCSPILTPDNSVIGISWVERDITLRKKAELRAREFEEIRDQFVEIISHQLRTPITAVNWNLEMLLGGNFGKLEETQYKFLQATYSASLEVTRRIHVLLEAMDIEEGRVRYMREEIVLNGLCSGVVHELERKAEIKNISLTYAPPLHDIQIIYGDSEKIRMAIFALVENAIDYTEEGGKVTAALRMNGDMIRFEVADTGIGIPADEQHLIYDRFYRASNASAMLPDAFGLGLFVTKSYVERYHGNIGFESKEGGGSKFWFELPIMLE